MTQPIEVDCPECDGSGREHGTDRKCSECYGEGTVTKPAPPLPCVNNGVSRKHRSGRGNEDGSAG